jgi:hypothetical protein
MNSLFFLRHLANHEKYFSIKKIDTVTGSAAYWADYFRGH